MRTYFFIGTLMDDDVVRMVLGRGLATLAPESAVLSGYRRVYVAAADYPGLKPAAEASVDGLLTRRITLKDAAKLRRFEGPGYVERSVEVMLSDGTSATATAFVPGPSTRLSNQEWVLSEWRKAGKRRFIRRGGP